MGTRVALRVGLDEGELYSVRDELNALLNEVITEKAHILDSESGIDGCDVDIPAAVHAGHTVGEGCQGIGG